MPRLLPEFSPSKRNAFSEDLVGPILPAIPPKELVEDIKALEFGRIPVPTLYVFNPSLRVILIDKKIAGEENGILGEQNYRNFQLIKYARISTVPYRMVPIDVGERLANDAVTMQYSRKVTEQEDTDQNQFMDENQLEAAEQVAAAVPRAARPRGRGQPARRNTLREVVATFGVPTVAADATTITTATNFFAQIPLGEEELP
jgi:hypothetical protein